VGDQQYAPYLRSDGCITPMGLTDLTVVSRRVLMALSKPASKERDFAESMRRSVNITLHVEGNDVARPAGWSILNAALVRLRSPWLYIPAASGDTDAIAISRGKNEVLVLIVLSCAGLRERAEPYDETLLVDVRSNHSLLAKTVPLEVSLTVQAVTSYAAWGRVELGGRCAPSTLRLDNGTSTDDQIRVAYTACDIDDLPVDHQLPTQSDNRRFSAQLTSATSTKESVRIEYLGSGVYEILLRVSVHGEYSVQLLLDGADAARLVGYATCPEDRVPLAEGTCGCRRGFFQLTEQEPCERCPSGTSSPNGALGREACDVCAEHFFRSLSSSLCVPCPTGSQCPWNTTVDSLLVVPGYWRLSAQASTIYRCTHDNNASLHTCVGGAPGDASCAAGHKGPRCEVCAESRHHFDGFSGVCLQCPDAGHGVAVTVAVVTPILFAVAVLYWIYAQRGPRLRSIRHKLHLCRQLMRSLGVMAKVKLVLSIAQVIASIDRTYQVGLPPTWHDWTNIFRVFGDIDWTGWIVPSDCIIGQGMVRAMLLRALTPLLFVAALPLLCAAAKAISQRVQSRNADVNSRPSVKILANKALRSSLRDGFFSGLPLSLFVSFCFTPSVSAFVFQAWRCEPFVYDLTEQHSFLGQDLSVRCDDSEEYKRVVATAWLLIVLWPIGMVALYASLLFPVRHEMFHGGDRVRTPLLKATVFLHRDYKEAFFWWEIFTLVQRTVLTGWLLLIDSDLPFLRLVSALVVTVFCLAALLLCDPYKSRIDFALATGGQLVLICIFIGGIMVRLYKDIAEDPFARAHPSGAAALAYRFLGLTSSEDAVTIMILVALFELVAFSITLAVQSYFQARPAQLEAKWSCCTLELPTMKWDLDGFYAAFLSHYKMEAASDARYLHDSLRKMVHAPFFLDSSSLNDLRELISDGLHNSDVFVLILTDGVLTRPW